MKNFIYYSVLIVLWATILVLLGIILVAIGGIEAQYYALDAAKLLQKSEMRKDIVIELSYKGFG